jgi:ankyrin repeat protein
MHLKGAIHRNPKFNIKQQQETFIHNKLSRRILTHAIENNEFEGMTGLTLCICLLILASGGRTQPTNNYVTTNPSGNSSSNNGVCNATNSTNAFNLQPSAYHGQTSTNIHSSQQVDFNKETQQVAHKKRKKKTKAYFETAENKIILETLINAIMAAESDIAAIRLQLNSLAVYQTEKIHFVQPLLNIAIEQGKIDVVRMLLEEGANPNGSTDETQPLALAAGFKRDLIAKLLVEKGARASQLRNEIRINKDTEHVENTLFASEGFSSMTALHVAVKYDSKSIDTLIDQGADIEAKASNGVKAIFLAVKYSTKALEILLARGAKIHTVEPQNGWTPLHAAAKWNPDAIPILIKNGADLTVLDGIGLTPLHVAAVSNSSAVSLLLAENVPVDPHENKEQATPLHFACKEKQLDSVEMLLKKGASPNLRNADGQTPLHLAAGAFEKAVPMLLAHGANPNIKDKIDGSTPFDYAIHYKRLKTVKMLLNHGAAYDRKSLRKLKILESDLGSEKHKRLEFTGDGIPAYAAEVFKLIEEHEQAAAEKSRKEMFALLQNFLQHAMKYLTILLPLFVIIYVLNRLRIQSYKAKALELHKAKAKAALNMLTNDFYYEAWEEIAGEKFSLKAETLVPLCIDSKIIVNETLKALQSIDREVAKVQDKIVVTLKRGGRLPNEVDKEKLANSLKQHSPEKKLEQLNDVILDAKSAIDSLIAGFNKNKDDVTNKISDIRKRKDFLQQHQNTNNTDLKRKIAKFLTYCDVVLRRGDEWLKLPIATLEPLCEAIVEKLKKLSFQLTSKKLDSKIFNEQHAKILEELEQLRKKHKAYYEDYNNNILDIRKKTDEVNERLGLPEEDSSKKGAEEIKPASAPRVMHIEVTTPVAPEIVGPWPTSPDEEEGLETIPEIKPIVEQPKLFTPIVLNLEKQPDERHKTEQPVLVTAARLKPQELPTVAMTFFASNVQDKKKHKERAKGNPILHINTANQDALNMSACLEQLRKGTALSTLDQLIFSLELLYHMIRFMKSLWDIFLFEKDNLDFAEQLGRLRHILVHNASIKYPTNNFQQMLIESADRLQTLLAEPFLVLCREKKTTLVAELATLVNNFPVLEIPLFNLRAERLSLNDIIEGLLEAINDIKKIGKVFTAVNQLNVEIGRTAAIKMLILKIGEYCTLLEETFPNELATVSSLLPKIPWDRLDKPDEIMPVTLICKDLRAKICHFTREKYDKSYFDIGGSLLFRLINSLLETDLTQHKIVEQLARKDKLINSIMRQLDDVAFRKSLSLNIMEAFENEKMPVPLDVLELFLIRKNLQANLVATSQELRVKHGIDQGARPSIIMLTLVEKGQTTDASRINEILQARVVNHNMIITACSQRETVMRFATAIQSGMEIGTDLDEKLLDERNSASLRLNN